MRTNKQLSEPNQTAPSMKVRELASLYRPDIKKENASKWLRKEISICAKLKEELSRTGWCSSQRIFTPEQVRIVIKHLGEAW